MNASYTWAIESLTPYLEEKGCCRQLVTRVDEASERSFDLQSVARRLP